MSILLPAVNLAGVTVGQTNKLDWSSIDIHPSYQEADTKDYGTIVLINASGVGLSLTFASGESIPLPDRGWAEVALAPDDVFLQWKVVYVLANSPVNTLFATIYRAGEPVDPIGNMGLSGNLVSAVTQVIQDGQASGQIIVESTPSGTGQTLLMTTDGNFTSIGTFKVAVIKGNSGAGDLYLISNNAGVAQLHVLFQVWNGTALVSPFGVGSGAAGLSFIDNLGVLTSPKVAFIGTPGSGSIDWEANLIVFRTPQAGATPQSHVFQVWDGAFSQNAFEVGREASPTCATNIAAATGAFSRIASQATAGSFGVPVIVAQALDVAVTVTTLQTILDYVTGATGFYRVNLYFVLNNSVSPQHIVGQVLFTDPDTSTQYFTSLIDDAAVVLNGANNVANAGHPCYAITMYAKTGTHITVQYQDPANVPNDHVTTLIERLA